MANIVNIIRWAVGSLVLAGSLSLGSIGLVLASQGDRASHFDEHHEREEHERHKHRQTTVRRPVSPDIAGLYEAECGACHLAYPAGLLSPDSWALIMNNPDDHFGENAELIDDGVWLKLMASLQTNAACPRDRILGSAGDPPPTRITSLAWFLREHDEIPKQLVADNAEIQTLGNCNACHRNASQGDFDEHSVLVPGYGRWDD